MPPPMFASCRFVARLIINMASDAKLIPRRYIRKLILLDFSIMLLSTQEYQTPNNNNPNTPTRHSTSISECLTKDVKKALPPTMLKTNACMHQLETRLAVMRQKKTIGFTGLATYELKDKENTWNKTTYMLLNCSRIFI